MKTRYSVFIICALILSLHLVPIIAQAPEIQWEKTYGSYWNNGLSVQQTTDGGYIISGAGVPTGDWGYDLLLIKTDSSGDTLWTKYIGGSGDWDIGGIIQQTADEGYIILGETNSYGEGGLDIWLIKTDSSGDTLWTKTYGGTGDDIGGGGWWQTSDGFQQTSDVGYIIAGVTNSFGAGGYDIWLIKTNSSGDTLWIKTYGGAGDDRDEQSLGIGFQQTTDGGYILAGTTDSYGAGAQDIWLIKTNSSGDTLWTKTYGGTGNDQSVSVQQTPDGGYIISGNTEPDERSWHAKVLLIKTDSSGNTLWTKTYGDEDNYAKINSPAQLTPDGGYIISGITLPYETSNYDILLVKTNSSGDTLWTKVLGGTSDEQCNFLLQTSDGGYFIGGWTASYGAGLPNNWFIKTNSSGDTQWTKVLGGWGQDFLSSGHQTTDGGYILTGTTQSFGDGIWNVWLVKLAPESGTVIETENFTQPTNFVLNQNYPNPFNPSTTVKYSIPKSSNVDISIYNLSGQKIKTLVNKNHRSGNYQVTWDGYNHASGVYIYQIKAHNFVQSKKMLLIK